MFILQGFDASSVANVTGSSSSALDTRDVSTIANASSTVVTPVDKKEMRGVFGGHGSSRKSFPIEALLPENEDVINSLLCVGS
jgi:hypothetical protein